MRTPIGVPGWLVASVLLTIGANLLAGVATTATVDLMHGTSALAIQARHYELSLLPMWRCLLYPTLTAVSVAYVWPLVRCFDGEETSPPDAVVRQRAINGPFVIAALGFLGWFGSAIFFPVATIIHFGQWAPDLMSQQVLSPLVNGFLAATTAYLVIDWVFRTRVVPRVFASIPAAAGTGIAVGVRGRLVIFLVAVAFVPLFTMLGLVRAAAGRLAAGWTATDVVPELVVASERVFALYLALGLALTLLLARTFTRPLAEVAAALRRVRAGTLDDPVRVSSADEIGVLEEGVNAMAATLRERERILQTFGRVVEPIVRDRLLAGELRGEGEVRTASVLFCDLRGFTGFAERTAPGELVGTLNQFFTTMTDWARTCDGFVDSFIGDGLLVVFGLFDDLDGGRARGAAAAVRCALGMRARLDGLNAQRATRGQAALGMKIGVHTGPVVAGTIGAADRHAYTVIGDTVNVAARLEEVCSELTCDVVVSATTWTLARGGGAELPLANPTSVVLRGRGEPVEVLRIGVPRHPQAHVEGRSS